MASQFRNLVFEGGGVKGIAFAGAIEVLERQGILSGIRRVAGTSAGAITATLLALGCTTKKLGHILATTNFNDFMDTGWGGRIAGAIRLVRKYGLYRGEALATWMREHIQDLAGDGDLTFRELKRKVEAREKGFRDLYVVGTDLSAQDCKIYSAESEHTPNIPIWEAVRTSMSIPLVFMAMARKGKILVDGGVSYNYPIDIFDDVKYLSKKSAGLKTSYPTKYDKDDRYNKETLGLRVDTQDEIRWETDNWDIPDRKIDGFKDYMGALYGFFSEMANKAHLHKNDWHRTIFIDAKGVKTTDFDLKRKKIEELVQSGRKNTKKYLEWFNNSRPTEKPLNKIRT